MLELRPNCEYCDKDLSVESTEARICSYECTFCAECAETVLFNVCPNCGGGFVARPIRPGTERRAGVSRQLQPPSSERRGLNYAREEIAVFVAGVKAVAAEDR